MVGTPVILRDGISIHALRKESDWMRAADINILCKFQSTLSVRRATLASSSLSDGLEISIHALRKESDTQGRVSPARPEDFNPRSP